MHIRILNYILESKIRIWFLSIMTWVTWYTLNFIWPVPELDILWNGLKIPDLIPFWYSIEYIWELFNQYDSIGRGQYELFLLTGDIIFPILYSLFFGMLLWLIIRNIHLPEQVKWMLISPPFIAACFDYIENISMIIALNTFPIIYSINIHNGSIEKIYKNIFSFIGIITLIWFSIYNAIHKIYKLKK